MMKRLAMVLMFLMISTAIFAAGNPVVVMKTNMGDVEIELFQDKAPVTVANFLSYVNKGFYNGTIFHRVMGNFMIQGGGFTPGMKEKKTSSPIKNEANNGLKNLAGTVAMARTADVNSATSQFFINVLNNPSLDYKSSTSDGFGYCVFGKVIKGMDVVGKIRSVQTGTVGYFDDVPVKDVVIISIKRKK
jgi:cyclophilin family peptidyl-prolyl cis-trans isomerase